MTDTASTLDHSDVAGRPVAFLEGSLPFGGSVADTPVYAVECPPYLEVGADRVAETRRTDIDMGGKLAFLVDGVLDAEEAARMTEITEGLGYRPEAPGIVTAPGLRQNKSVHWVADDHTLAVIYDRLAPHLPAELDGQKLVPRLSRRLNMYRYDRGDVFNPHIDGDWPGFGLSDDGQAMVQWPGVWSKLTMVLYLNGAEDGVEGGETVLYDEGEVRAVVTPKAGRALFFRHGHSPETVLHAGAPVNGEVCKYVARINVLYEADESMFVRAYPAD